MATDIPPKYIGTLDCASLENCLTSQQIILTQIYMEYLYEKMPQHMTVQCHRNRSRGQQHITKKKA